MLENMKQIPGFKTIKAIRLNRKWYIIDCTEGCGDPFKNSIGGSFESYDILFVYAKETYTGIYK